MAEDFEHLRNELERLDTELGSVIRSWATAIHDIPIDLHGPFRAPGMDPTWILRLSGEHLDAEAFLFLGPHLEVSAFRPASGGSGGYVGHDENFAAGRLVEMLDDLADACRGGPLPAWLRSTDM